MRLLVLTALAALTITGQAASQPSDPGTPYYPFQGTSPNDAPPRTPHFSPAAEAAYRQMHFACEADQQSLCASKKGHAIGQCLRDHTKVVSPPCKAAIVQARRADNGKL